IRRTVKFLSALAAGKHIVNVKWLDQCKKDKRFVSETRYLLKDKAAERNYGFSLEESMTKARTATEPLFDGMEFYLTEHVKPGPADMGEMLSAAGGKVVTEVPIDIKQVDQARFVIIGSDDDTEECRRLNSQGWTVHSAEFILTGILRHEIDFDKHRLHLKVPTLSRAGTGSVPSSARKKRG
ncbi:Mediator of DNA damage checkpoint protein 1, partial [Blyttiomyces sp. JEL0837]